MTDFTVDTARRMALAAQGFADSRPSGLVDVRHLPPCRELSTPEADVTGVALPHF